MTTELNFGDLPGTEEYTYREHPAVANSDLRYLHSPVLFNLHKSGAIETKVTEAMRIGSLIDCYLLDKDEFNKKYILQPELNDVPTSPQQEGFAKDILSLKNPLEASEDLIANIHAKHYQGSSKKSAKKMYKEFFDYFSFKLRARGKEIYSLDDLGFLKSIEHNTFRHKKFQEFIYNPPSHYKVIKHLQIIGVDLWGVEWKGELDLVVLDFKNKRIYNIDIKTTRDTRETFPYSYINYHYNRQQALYRKLLTHYLEERGIVENISEWIVCTRCLVIYKQFPYECDCIPIPENVLVEGERQLKEAANKIRYYTETGWINTRSYLENGGLEVINWSEYL